MSLTHIHHESITNPFCVDSEISNVCVFLPPGAQACVLVFSTTDRESYQAISSWREKVEVEVGDIPTVLVQNKIDLLDDTVIKK